MVCSVQDLREREIINLKDGARLGSVCDVEIDTLSGSIVSIVIYGKGRFPFKRQAEGHQNKMGRN